MTQERRGDWLQTFPSGSQFWPLDPRPEDFHIADIAHALAHLCRFGGHCRAFYSVAEHSVHVSNAVPAEDALRGLMHDAAEAYVLDIPRPLKRSQFLGRYAEIEEGVQTALELRFGITGALPPSVKIADHRVLLTEKRDLCVKTAHVWTEAQARDASAKPYGFTIEGWPSSYARTRFLSRFHELTEGRFAKVVAGG